MEKEYPRHKEDTGMAKEPVAVAGYMITAKRFNDTDGNVPVVIPATWEEALADIEQSEMDFAEGRYFAWDEVKRTMEDRISGYAN